MSNSIFFKFATAFLVMAVLCSDASAFQVTDANNESFENADTKERQEQTADDAKKDEAENTQAAEGSGSEAEPEEKELFDFTVEQEITCTPIRSQDRTGTCWCFAGTSFIESELIRRSEGTLDLSEMFVVKNVYRDKALNYVLRHGKTNFGQGALAHDYLNAVGKYGVVPEEVFTGKTDGESAHDHGEMEAMVKAMLDATIKRRTISPRWQTATQGVLDVYLGEAPEKFQHEGRSYTPKEFAKFLEFNADDYISFTSYTHHPFHRPFVLEIPDNFSNGSFSNVPVDDLIQIIDGALDQGYSLMWDGDVSEAGFSAKKGMAILPVEKKEDEADDKDDEKEKEIVFDSPVEQMKVTQELRQKRFLSYATTDDHLMHLVGRVVDQNGTRYYMIKNSWGEIGVNKGYLYMSEAYVRLHTLAITLNKECVENQYLK